MTPTNPYAAPKANVLAAADADIDRLPVSEKWKTRFKMIRKAGGPKLPKLKQLSRQERGKVGVFNILAFLFGPFYYLAKGMWRKAISLFVVCAVAVIIASVILELIGFGKFASALGYAVAAVFAVRANIDYYKTMVLGDNGWW